MRQTRLIPVMRPYSKCGCFENQKLQTLKVQNRLFNASGDKCCWRGKIQKSQYVWTSGLQGCRIECAKKFIQCGDRLEHALIKYSNAYIFGLTTCMISAHLNMRSKLAQRMDLTGAGTTWEIQWTVEHSPGGKQWSIEHMVYPTYIVPPSGHLGQTLLYNVAHTASRCCTTPSKTHFIDPAKIKAGLAQTMHVQYILYKE